MELSKENQEWLDRNKYDDGLGGYDMSPNDVKAKLIELETQLKQANEELELMKLTKDTKAITMLYAFGGYITSMNESITFGSNEWATPAVDIITGIVESNNLVGECNFDDYVSPNVQWTSPQPPTEGK